MTDIIPAFGDDKSRELFEAAKENAASHFLEWHEYICLCCQSPIEKIFLAAMLADVCAHEIEWHAKDFNPEKKVGGSKMVDAFAQVPLGKYVADFLFVRNVDQKVIVVECDGHDYHERTKGQAARDRARDRWMTQNDILVFRFTGSELFNNPEACAEQMFEVLLP